MSKFEKDLSQGNVGKQLIKFAVPFLISNLIQSLYNVSDMIIVGRFNGQNSMSGINIGGQITQVLTQLVIGLCSGATALIGQYIGGNNRKDLKETIGTLLSLLLVIAITISSIIIAFRIPLLNIMNTPKEALEEAKGYLLITSLGFLFIFGYNALSAVMRGMGDSVRPLIFVGISCTTNIILDLVLVGGMHMGAKGAASATVFSQALSLSLCITYLRKNNFIFDFKFSSFHIKRNSFTKLMKIGLPTSIQNIVTGVSFMVLTSIINTLGVTASAAVGAVGKVTNFVLMPTLAMQASIIAMSAQNIGAKNYSRAKSTMKIGMSIVSTISFILVVIVQCIPDKILRIFCSDQAVIDSGVTYIRHLSFDYLPATVLLCFVGFFIGAGYSKFSLICSMLSAVFLRVPVAYLLGIKYERGLSGIGLAAPVATAGALVLTIVFYYSGIWKKSCI